MSDQAAVTDLVLRWQQEPTLSAEELCADCPALLDAVRQRLEALRSMEALLAPSASGANVGSALATLSPDSAAAPVPGPGAAIPGYELLGEAGRGGMGVVYKARQIRANRVVALKMILARSHATLEQKVRFQIEAEAVARLTHPHIVQLHEVGDHEGLPFFTLEFCDGSALDRQLKDGPFAAAEAAALVEKLARAIHYAHLRGVVHRDLKPGNVLMTADGVPKITDFGLAKRLDIDNNLSQTGEVLGTASYMAPEQTTGKTGEIGPAVDVYALGAVLYECLTGQPPFRAATTFETLQQVLNAEPSPPSRLNPRVPRDLETICLKCLHKESGKRYASAERLADDLDRFLRGEPVLARPIGRAERLWRWCRRNPMVAGLTAAVAALLVAVAVAATWAAVYYGQMAERESQAARSERAARATAEQQKERADHKTRWARRAVNDMYSEVAEKWLAEQPHMTDVQREFLHKALVFYEELAREGGTAPEERLETAIAYRRVGAIRHTIADDKRAEEPFRQAQTLVAGLVKEFPKDARYQRELFLCHLQRGTFLRSIDLLDQARGPLAGALAVANGLVKAWPDEPAHRQALALVHENLGILETRVHQQSAAEQHLRQALTIQQSLASRLPPFAGSRERVAQLYLDLGELLLLTNRPRDAEEAVHQAIKTFKALEAETPTLTIRYGLGGATSNQGELLLHQGRLEEAAPVLAEALRIRQRIRDDFPALPRAWFGLAITQSHRGRLLARLGGYAEAEKAFLDALGYQEKLVKVNQSVSRSRQQELGLMRSNLAWLYTVGSLKVRNAAKGLELSDKALQLEKENPAYLTAQGVAYYRLGEPWKARACLQQSAAVAKRIGSGMSEWISDCPALQRAAEINARMAAVANGFVQALCYSRDQAAKARACYEQALQTWKVQREAGYCRAEELEALRQEVAAALGLEPAGKRPPP